MKAKDKNQDNDSVKIAEVESELPYLTMEKVKAVVDDLYSQGIIEDYCYILHDKDRYTKKDEKKNPLHKEGMLKTPHIHCYLRFNNSYKFKTIANWFDIPVNYVRYIGKEETLPDGTTVRHKGNYKTACAYAIHLGKLEKYQYDVSEVVSNFDYTAFIEELKAKESAKENDEDYTKRMKKRIREEVQAGTLRGYNFYENYTYEQRLQFRPYLNTCINEVIKTKLSKNEDRNLEVIYVYGDSDVGKTSYAKQIARQRGLAYCVSGGNNDPVEAYDSQPCMILDELRPSSMKLAAFLKLIDNNTESMVEARYHGKAFIECKLIIITSTKSIGEFFKNLQETESETAVQIMRRCKTLLHMTKDRIEISEWNDSKRAYVKLPRTIKNPISDMYGAKPETDYELMAQACSVLGVELSDLDKPLVDRLEDIDPLASCSGPADSVRLHDDGERLFLIVDNVSENTKERIIDFSGTLCEPMENVYLLDDGARFYFTVEDASDETRKRITDFSEILCEKKTGTEG